MGFLTRRFRWEFYIVWYTLRDYRNCTRWRVYTANVCVGLKLFCLRLSYVLLFIHVETSWCSTRGLSHPVNSSSPNIEQFGSVSFLLSRKEGGRPLPLRHCDFVFIWLMSVFFRLLVNEQSEPIWAIDLPRLKVGLKSTSVLLAEYALVWLCDL